jgi:hypothetical protein
VGDSAGGWVEKEEELTNSRFVAVDGWENTCGRPAGGAQVAWPRSVGFGGPPV